MGIELVLTDHGDYLFGGTEKDIRQQKYEGRHFDFFRSAGELQLAFSEAEERRTAEIDALKARQTQLGADISGQQQRLVELKDTPHSGFFVPEVK